MNCWKNPKKKKKQHNKTWNLTSPCSWPQSPLPNMTMQRITQSLPPAFKLHDTESHTSLLPPRSSTPPCPGAVAPHGLDEGVWLRLPPRDVHPQAAIATQRLLPAHSACSPPPPSHRPPLRDKNQVLGRRCVAVGNNPRTTAWKIVGIISVAWSGRLGGLAGGTLGRHRSVLCTPHGLGERASPRTSARDYHCHPTPPPNPLLPSSIPHLLRNVYS